MEKFKVTFTAENQQLKSNGIKHASDTYADIEAAFILGAGWTDMDSVTAVWWNDFTKIATVLDSEGTCTVPHEVLTRKGCVRVNLVGSIVENGELVIRLTSYSAEAIQVNEKIKLTGSETTEITPSQYEQFAANVRADADRAEAAKDEARESATAASASAQRASESAAASSNSATRAAQASAAAEVFAQSASEASDEAEAARDAILGMRATATTLPEGSDATANYSDGLLTLGIPRGDRGEQGIQGETGATPNLTIGTVETLAPTEDATATITGTAENPVLNLGIPKGKEYDDAEIRGQLTDLKSDFSDISNVANTVSDVTEVALTLTSGYMDKSGNIGASSQYSYTQKISVKIGDIVHLRNDNNKREYNQFRHLTAFRGSAVDSDKGTDSNSRTYTVPDGITDVILTIDTTAYPSCTVLINERILKVADDAVNVGVASSKSIIDNSFVYTNGIKVEEITVTKNNGYMDQNGVVSASTGMIYTQPIPVNAGDILTMRNDNRGSLITPMRAITTFDALMYPISEEGSSSAVNSYTVPNGVSFVVITIADSTYPNTTILKATGKYLLSDTSLGSDATEVIETIKTSFNLVDNAFIKEVTPTKSTGYMNPDGTVGNYSQFRYTQKIPVKVGNVITMRNDDTGATPRAMRVITAFNGTLPVVASGTDANVSTYTVPDGINNIVVTVDNSANPNFTILQSTSGYISKADASNRIPELVLPSKSIAVVGHEWNMYYDNVVDGLTDDYYIFCSGVSGKSYGNFLRFTPSNGDIGTHTITVNLYSKAKGSIVATSSFDLVVIADSAPTKNVIFIGDSLTQEGTYINEIQNVLSNGNIKSVGTRTEVDSGYSGLHHEGRAGWSAYDYVEQSSKNGVTNAFWNSNTSAFDFSNYMSVNGFSDVDCVMLNLGTNGVEHTERTCDAIGEIIASIHAYDSSIKVIVSLITPPATQDGCGNHNGMFDANAYKRNELKLVEKYIELYDGVNSNVYVSEPYFNLDRLHDFATTTIAISSRNPNTMVVQNNNVHPSVYGYLKIADVYYNNLLYRLN